MRKTVRLVLLDGNLHGKLLILSSFVELHMEDSVLIRNCPPISARKRFTLEKVIRSPETERALAHATASVASPTPVP